MYKWYKILALLLVCMLTIGLFAGCSGKEKPAADVSKPVDDNRSSSAQQSQVSGPEPLTLPIVKEPLKLTYWVSLDPKATATMKTYAEIKCYQELQKITGINLEFVHPPAGQEAEQFNLMLASQDLPDIVFYSWRTIPGGPAKALNDGAIITLNDLISKYAPNFNKIMNEHPQWRKETVLDDGTFYMFPVIYGSEYQQVSGGFQMRKDWLDNLGLQSPKTIDQWYSVLTAFKQEDANKNGDSDDEIPFVSQGAGGLRYFEYAWGIIHGFFQDNGKIKYGPIEAAYKDYLNTMQKWYKEGLIDADYASTDRKNFDAKITGHKAGAFYGAVNGNLGTYMALMKDKDPKFELIGVPWPTGPAGKNYGFRDVASLSIGGTITSKNKYPKESVKLIDYAYSPEGALLINFGPDGGAIDMVNGYPKYKDNILHDPTGLSFAQASYRYGVAVGVSFPTVQDPRYYEQSLSDFPQKKAAVDTWFKHDPSLLLPPLTPTSEESQRLAAIMNEINTYVDEMFNKFIMGQESLNNFDNYVQTIKNMGIEEAIKIEQAALDRFNKR